LSISKKCSEPDESEDPEPSDNIAINTDPPTQTEVETAIKAKKNGNKFTKVLFIKLQLENQVYGHLRKEYHSLFMRHPKDSFYFRDFSQALAMLQVYVPEIEDPKGKCYSAQFAHTTMSTSYKIFFHFGQFKTRRNWQEGWKTIENIKIRQNVLLLMECFCHLHAWVMTLECV